MSKDGWRVELMKLLKNLSSLEFDEQLLPLKIEQN